MKRFLKVDRTSIILLSFVIWLLMFTGLFIFWLEQGSRWAIPILIAMAVIFFVAGLTGIIMAIDNSFK